MFKYFSKTILFICLAFSLNGLAQTTNNSERKFSINTGGTIEIKNHYGKIDVKASEDLKNEVLLNFNSTVNLSEKELRIKNSNGYLNVEIIPNKQDSRIDLTLLIPIRTKIRLETNDGQISVGGNFAQVEAETITGTIYADVPLEDVRYKFLWTASRPRFVSDVKLEEVEEKSAGKFVVQGKLHEEVKIAKSNIIIPEDEEDSETSDEDNEQLTSDNEPKSKTKDQSSKTVSLDFRTARGIILFNVPPNEVPSDLSERPLTEAAKAVIRSGDSLLTEAIRRASPKYFGEYAATLPPRENTPFLNTADKKQNNISASVKKVNVQVVDLNNRAVADLTTTDFELLERGDQREILLVEPTTSPFNLVLLLDVSGSIENYVDFIRKAARNFVNTVGTQDKLSIVIFNEDVKTLSTFSTDKNLLSDSLDTFDAGGGTAYYDSLAYVLTDTLRPMKGDRTAIVVLSDGDDNRSFLPFNALLGSIQESGALVYPLYVPSALIAAGDENEKSSDPLRNRFLSQTLSSKAQSEGEELAKISGGVYYPIDRLSQIQTAYDDIVKQLRTSYTITYRSDLNDKNGDKASPRLKVKVKKENTFVKLGTVVAVENREVSQVQDSRFKVQDSRFKTQDSESVFQKIKYFDEKQNLKPETLNFESGILNLESIEEITGEVSSIKYKQFIADKLKTFQFVNFDINKTDGAFLFEQDRQKIAISRWISPKRTRSYPYERVYDTLTHDGKKVAIIPVVKDEGIGGDRDFIQWDTVSLLSLLDVHVVLAYYADAEKNPKGKDKITNQKFDNEFIKTKLDEILKFKGSSRDWNEAEAKNLKAMFEKAKTSYREIANKTSTALHDAEKLDELIKYAETPERFIGYSRRNAQNAQSREFQTIQPNEALSTLSKGKITITNSLYGKYFFTVDETKIEPNLLSLIEAKHSSRSIMPSKNDIKDGLIKMMLYTNLTKVKYGEKSIKHKVFIRLTSNKLKGSTNSGESDETINQFFTANLLNSKQKEFVKQIFQEARANNFTIILEKGETSK